jgi:hypothetical protein
METELLTLLGAQTVGFSIFGKFQAETPWWQMTLKWILIITITYILYSFFGHVVALGLLGVALIISVCIHFIWCKRNGIHPLHATPKRKYYELRNWKWTE